MVGKGMNALGQGGEKFHKAVNIYKTGGKYPPKPYGYLGCHTITVSQNRLWCLGSQLHAVS